MIIPLSALWSLKWSLPDLSSFSPWGSCSSCILTWISEQYGFLWFCFPFILSSDAQRAVGFFSCPYTLTKRFQGTAGGDCRIQSSLLVQSSACFTSFLPFVYKLAPVYPEAPLPSDAHALSLVRYSPLLWHLSNWKSLVLSADLEIWQCTFFSVMKGE